MISIDIQTFIETQWLELDIEDESDIYVNTEENIFNTEEIEIVLKRLNSIHSEIKHYSDDVDNR